MTQPVAYSPPPHVPWVAEYEAKRATEREARCMTLLQKMAEAGFPRMLRLVMECLPPKMRRRLWEGVGGAAPPAGRPS